MRSRLALLTLLLLTGGCSNRERSNPLDPGNPITGGRPIGFRALAGNGIATLQWNPVIRQGLTGYQAFRRFEGEVTFTPLTGVLPVATDRFTDFGLANGKRHDYQLFYVFEAGRAGLPAEDTAVPGPLVPWVTDLGRARLLRLTPDVRHVAFELTPFEGPTDVAVDAVNGSVWTVDTFGGRVVVYDPQSQSQVVISDAFRPVAVAVDPRTHNAWVCDEGRNLVLHFRESGAPAQPELIGPVLLPIAAAVDPNDGSLWVCERQAENVRRFTSGGTLAATATIERPSRVAVDSATGNGWVTSFERGRVVRLSTSGAVLETIAGFRGPIGITVDARRGRVWVADAVAGHVVALRRDGSEEFRVGGLREVRELAVDVATGDAWAVVAGNRSVTRLSPAGAVTGVLGGLIQPYDIALDPGPSASGPPRSARSAHAPDVPPARP